MIEVSRVRGSQVGGSSVDLNVLQASWDQMTATGGRQGSEVYNAAVKDLTFQLTGPLVTLDRVKSVRAYRGGQAIEIPVDLSGMHDRAELDRLISTDSFRVKQGFRSETKTSGLGVPLVARQPWGRSDVMVARSGLWFPATAYVDFTHREHPVLRVVDPSCPRTSTVSLGGVSDVPLQANYTASLARDLLDRQLNLVSLESMLRYDKFSENMGLIRISAFHPEKTPVILVHGLKSSPNTWNNTLNEMLADPEVRENYEFWTFGYPTGAPIPFLSMKLREEMGAMLAFRRKQGAPTNEVVVLSHSMGGLISKPLTQSSGQEQWSQLFKVQPEQIDSISPKQRTVLRKMFFFEPMPEIKRLVFVATPHQGSKIASKAPGKVASALIEGPQQIVVLSRDLVTAGGSALTPMGVELFGEFPSSIRQLRNSSAVSSVFGALPLSSRVKYHSIIGNEDRARVPLEKTSDGVVPYLSAHIDGVESEKVVKGEHGVHSEPEAIKELVRILHLHLARRPSAQIQEMDPE
ncbi:MAG: hypothetical protein AAF226_14655, partial [Verrucomicrobiota bacterium]